MNILQLRYFTTVAQLENVSRAAELLHMTQSSLSKNIAKLEDELGMPLFERSGKKLRLNAAGARFLECSNLILRELEYALDDMNLLSTGTDSRIKVGMAGISERVMTCVTAFRRDNPEAEFDLTGNIECLERLDINDYDALIYPEGLRYQKFTGKPLYEERYYLAVEAGHPLAAKASILPRELSGESLVFLRSGKVYAEYPFRVCTALALQFGTLCYVDTRELHRQVIASGAAAGFVPESALTLYQNDAQLRLIPIFDQRFTRRMMICFRREKHLSQLARSFRDYVREYFRLDERTV